MGTSQASDYLENKLIDHIFRTATFAKPAALHVGLFTAAPSDLGGGTELSGGGYVRGTLPPGDANWKATQGGVAGVSSGAGGTTTNAVVVAFPIPTADWGVITHVGIFDAPTAGNLLIWDALTAPRTVLLGDPAPSFPIDAIQISFS
jgi:hypothetical protein